MGSHHTQDINFVHVNSWPRLGLGQLVFLQFLAVKGLNLDLWSLHDTWVYIDSEF